MRTACCLKKTCTQNKDSHNQVKVLYIPGFLSGQNPQKEAKKELRRQFPRCKVDSMAWDETSWLDIFCGMPHRSTAFCSLMSAWISFASSSRPLFEKAAFFNPKNAIGSLINPPDSFLNQWRRACKNAQMVAKELAKLIEKMPKTERSNLILVGHSLGAYIIVKTLELLSRRQIKINRAVLLGAAIDSNDSAIPAACRATDNPIEFTVNPMDWALILYQVVSFNTALGKRGYSGKKSVSLIERRLFPVFTHSSAFYIKQMGNNRKSASKPTLSLPSILLRLPFI